MPALAISLLGAPSVALPHGSTARGLGAAKGLALLAYLTLEPGSHSREELATLLWGDSSDAAARASLRQALKRLRAVVGEALHVDRTHVELRGPVECDVAAFLAAAAARLAEFSTRLAREVEAEPGVALQHLARRIEREAGRERSPDANEVASDPDLEARLVGREAPWRSLTQAWAALSRRAGRVVLIDGDAGVGKTRLAEEFLRWASLEGATILRGHAYDTQTGMPYGPVVEALRDGLDAPGASGTAPERLPEATPPRPGPRPPD